jgi:ribonuclease PH
MTSEGTICSEENFSQMMNLAKIGINNIINIQKSILV